MKLSNFLAQKPLYYREIDYTRVPRAFESIKDKFQINSKVIHIIGTNGKGTTGRFLAYSLYKLGFSVGHYSSPHILKFNERIWLNGEDIDDESLEVAHQKLLSILPIEFQNSLSYFEYTTLLALILFENLDYIVLEAGLGGEYDATNVVKKDLTLVTPIGFDHQDFLGSKIEEIAKTKLNSIEKYAIIAKQEYKEVYEVLEELKIQKDIEYYKLEESLNQRVESFKNYPKFLIENLNLALLALKFFDLKIDLKELDDIELFGRCSKFRDNITIDVGHNSLSAKAITKHFKSLNREVILIYNSFKDKEYREILSILKPIVKHIEILEIDSNRVIQREKLERAILDLDIEYQNFKKIDDSKEYLVYGSFSVVETFLERVKI